MWIVFAIEAIAAGLPGLASHQPRDAAMMHGVYFVVLFAAAWQARARPEFLSTHFWKFHVLATVVFGFEALGRLRFEGSTSPTGLLYALCCVAALLLAHAAWSASKKSAPE